MTWVGGGISRKSQLERYNMGPMEIVATGKLVVEVSMGKCR